MLFLMVETFSNGGGQFRKKNENLIFFLKKCLIKPLFLSPMAPRSLENVIFDGSFIFQRRYQNRTFPNRVHKKSHFSKSFGGGHKGHGRFWYSFGNMNVSF